MTDIEIVENKNVTFRNVLSRVLESTNEESIQKSARMFESYLKREKLQPYGPLIIRTTNKLIGRENVQSSEMLAQLREPPSEVENPYSFEPIVRIENCLMARYIGPQDHMQMAYAKMQVYAFEKQLDLGPVTYSVLTPDGEEFMADIFTEVL